MKSPKILALDLWGIGSQNILNYFQTCLIKKLAFCIMLTGTKNNLLRGILVGSAENFDPRNKSISCYVLQCKSYKSRGEGI
jgi:RNA recognition motif-containing protein